MVRSYWRTSVVSPSKEPEDTYLYPQKVAVLRRQCHHSYLENRVEMQLGRQTSASSDLGHTWGKANFQEVALEKGQY